MNDKVEQARFIYDALVQAEAAAQALPPGPQRRALIASHRRLHARLYAGLKMLESEAPGVTAQVVPDSGGGDKNTSYAPGIGAGVRQAA